VYVGARALAVHDPWAVSVHPIQAARTGNHQLPARPNVPEIEIFSIELKTADISADALLDLANYAAPRIYPITVVGGAIWRGLANQVVLAHKAGSPSQLAAQAMPRRTKNLRAVQLLLGHTKLESTVRYLGIEVDDALEISEQTEV
jgi:hypothetical protein